MIDFKQKGGFSNLESFFKNRSWAVSDELLHRYGKEGVKALSDNTPKDTGLTSSSWYYDITRKNNKVSLNFYNSNISYGVPVAILIQNGHITKSGTWSQGIDYINPSLGPIYTAISNELWKGVHNK